MNHLNTPREKKVLSSEERKLLLNILKQKAVTHPTVHTQPTSYVKAAKIFPDNPHPQDSSSSAMKIFDHLKDAECLDT
ncbi:hypothetical protein NPIL_438891, partial [Nephila pilipes]